MCEANTAGPDAPGAAPFENQPTVAASGGTCRERSSLKPSSMIESRVTPIAGISMPVGAEEGTGSATEGAAAGAANRGGTLRPADGPCALVTTATRATPARSTTMIVVRTEAT